jgi:hypothetical protein
VTREDRQGRQGCNHYNLGDVGNLRPNNDDQADDATAAYLDERRRILAEHAEALLARWADEDEQERPSTSR